MDPDLGIMRRAYVHVKPGTNMNSPPSGALSPARSNRGNANRRDIARRMPENVLAVSERFCSEAYALMPVFDFNPSVRCNDNVGSV